MEASTTPTLPGQRASSRPPRWRIPRSIGASRLRDLSGQYLHLAHALHEAGARLALATHDRVVREAVLAALGPTPVEMLLGVRGEEAAELVGRGVPVRLYVPYGEGWFRYWMRRVAEAQGA